MHNPSLFYEINKVIGLDHFYHWPEGKNANYQLCLIISVVIDSQLVVLRIDSLRFFLKVGEVEQNPFQRVAFRLSVTISVTLRSVLLRLPP